MPKTNTKSGINIKQRESREAKNEYLKRWRAQNKEKCREYDRKKSERGAYLERRYGITKEQYGLLLEDQNYRCAICQTKEPGGHHKVFHVDHCHKWGHVRGLLCDKCNRGLGFFNDSVPVLVAAACYLQENKIADHTH